MSFWTAVVIIVAIVALTEVMKSKHRARHGITTDALGTRSRSLRRPTPRWSARSRNCANG